MDPHDLDGQRPAYRLDFPFFDENERMLVWYADRLVDCVVRQNVRSALSLGVGQRIVSLKLAGLVQSGVLDQYTVVDGSPEAIREVRHEYAGLSVGTGAIRAISSYFETFDTDSRFDLIEMGFVLEHVDDPTFILGRFVEFLRPGGVCVIAVPNARSLHRLIGREAGLLEDLYGLSEADVLLGHQRYFDLAGLRALIDGAQLVAETEEGILLKPLTTGQLDSLQLSADVLQALCRVAVDYPEISNALYMECRQQERSGGD